METIHHVLMVASALENSGLSDELIDKCLAWSAIPDIVQADSPKPIRVRTHLETCEVTGELHATQERISDVFLRTPPSGTLACPMWLGAYMHLFQDREYDRWISQWVEMRGNGEEVPYTYFFRETGAEICPEQVHEIKKLSWREGLKRAFSDIGINREDDKIEWIVQHVIKPLEYNPICSTAMLSYLMRNYDSARMFPGIQGELAVYEDEIAQSFLNTIKQIECKVPGIFSLSGSSNKERPDI